MRVEGRVQEVRGRALKWDGMHGNTVCMCLDDDKQEREKRLAW